MLTKQKIKTLATLNFLVILFTGFLIIRMMGKYKFFFVIFINLITIQNLYKEKFNMKVNNKKENIEFIPIKRRNE